MPSQKPKSEIVADSPNAVFLNRRELLATAGAAWLVSGCSRDPEPLSSPTVPRSDVPIQITWVGSEQDAESIRRAWAAVDPQPLKIKSLPFSRANEPNWISDLVAEAQRSDLVIYPLLATAELVGAEALVPISDEQFDEMEQELGPFLSAPRNGAARYADEYVAMPLGARLPALLSILEVPDLVSWADYDSWVATELEGQAAEPLADGWAAVMFLWRAVSSISSGWLFTRDDFVPTIQSPPYVEVLTQMAETATRYKSGRLTPDQIWESLQKGEIAGGIGFPTTPMTSETEITISDLPGGGESIRMLLDPFSPVVSVSSHCRQSSASKRLMNWLSGGEGSQLLRREVRMITPTRSAKPSVLATESQAGNPYEKWLVERLTLPVTVPSLQLHSADAYYRSLDEAVGRCVDGQTSAEDALREVAEQWQTLTQRIGKEKQLSAWRRAQGLRA
ncbi:type 2 periplasmic-binding domain-containing protein [Novipirellula artificiosorum]|uniref:Bacterial extracellular solute-binding protein n=1 Tax=Novipirellula artificiosorum TaxID=2528016 RepID=A0A5C6E1E7_9BACT|nr:hypothetical protein [Novipirellula artificiosorum]TWU42710.1 hypothetical protein Poly41_10100 [Novipirellula artificiosorum]